MTGKTQTSRPQPIPTGELDTQLAERLGTVEQVLDLYRDEASVYRPILTGDVFFGVPVSGFTDKEGQWGMTMILSHPCGMRKGAVLEPRALAGPIAQAENLSKRKYTRGHHDRFSLPQLNTVAAQNGFQIEDEPWCTLLDASGRIETSELDVQRRVACLSSKGVVLLVQKLVHCGTRVIVLEKLIAEAMTLALEEIEQLQTWQEDLAAPKVEAGADLNTELGKVAKAFTETLDPMRPLLEDPTKRGEVWRSMNRKLKELRPEPS